MRTFEDDDPLFAPMLNALFAAFRGTAVMSGCAPSATGADRVVTVTAGSVQIGGATVAVAGGTVTLDAGGETDRYDLVTVDAAGGLAVTKGTVERKCPTQPANTCLLAIVFVPAGATVIATGDVYDARMLSQNLAAAAIECAGTIAATKFDCATYVLSARGGVCYRDNSTMSIIGPGSSVVKTASACPANRSGEVLVRYNAYPYAASGAWGRLLKNGSPIAGSQISDHSAAYDLPVLVAPGDVIALEIGHEGYYAAINTLFEIHAVMTPASSVVSLW
jgi:hypothetical protein